MRQFVSFNKHSLYGRKKHDRNVVPHHSNQETVEALTLSMRMETQECCDALSHRRSTTSSTCTQARNVLPLYVKGYAVCMALAVKQTSDSS
jgi:hypothetical protein